MCDYPRMLDAVLARFARVRAKPDGANARREASAILGALEAEVEPSDAAVTLITDDAFLWVGLGLARRARAILERWRRGGAKHAALGRAEAILTVAIAPPAAASRLRALDGDPIASAVTVANHVFRGELRPAIERCRAEGWFLDEPGAITAISYGTWALAMLDDFDGALAVIGMWRHRHPGLPAATEQSLLAAEARIESVRYHHRRERALLEEALAICDEHELGLARTYLESSLAISLARSGDLTAATRLVRKWKRLSEQELEVYRDVARTEIALLAGDYKEVDVVAKRILAFAESTGNAIYACHARGYRAFAASRAKFPALVEEYGRAVVQLQIPVYLRRHRLLTEIAAAQLAPRDRCLVARTRRAQATVPIMRTFFPTLAEVNADLCWDRVQQVLYLGGEGPFKLADHPILRKLLEVILAARDFCVPLEALFEQVWGMAYKPIVHEGKCHVALHRLRALLGGWRAGADRLVVVRDGAVRISDDCSAIVLELPPVRIEDPSEPLDQRIVAYLAVVGEQPMGHLVEQFGASRTSLQLALRQLVARGTLQRSGKARATTYRVRERRRASSSS